MSVSASRQVAPRWLVAWWVLVLSTNLGCLTLDGRARIYPARVQIAAPAGNAPDTSRTQTSVGSPSAGDFEAEKAAPQSVESRAPSLDLHGVERSYLLPTGDTITHVKVMATRYANLQPAACRAEVRRRRIAAISASGLAVGIAAPMRLVGSLHNVRFVTPGPKSVHGMLDCRLVLLLDELSGVLDALGVAVVYVDGFYRAHAHLPGKKSPSQHAFGLAIDIHALGTKDGRTLIIERDFAGRIGAPVCGEAAVLQPESRDAVALRNIVCAIVRAKAFHYLLTPNYDEAHSNHLHGDIKRGSREYVLR